MTDATATPQFGQLRFGRQRFLQLLDGLVGADGLHSYAPILPRHGRRYPIGLRTIGAQQVYTDRGLGVWLLPFRLNCRPEISLFTLLPRA